MVYVFRNLVERSFKHVKLIPLTIPVSIYLPIIINVYQCTTWLVFFSVSLVTFNVSPSSSFTGRHWNNLPLSSCIVCLRKRYFVTQQRFRGQRATLKADLFFHYRLAVASSFSVFRVSPALSLFVVGDTYSRVFRSFFFHVRSTSLGRTLRDFQSTL